MIMDLILSNLPLLIVFAFILFIIYTIIAYIRAQYIESKNKYTIVTKDRYYFCNNYEISDRFLSYKDNKMKIIYINIDKILYIIER